MVNQVPADIGTETALLGTFLVGAFRGDPVEDFTVMVSASDFALPAHAVIWNEAIGLLAETKTVAPQELFNRCKVLGSVNGSLLADYIQNLFENDHGVACGPSLAERVAETARKKKLLQLGEWLCKQSVNGETSGAICDRAMEALGRLAGGSRLSVESRGDAVENLVGKIERGEYKRGLSSGFWAVDDLLGGFRHGHYIIVAARPGMGKSGFLLDVCSAATTQDIPALIISLEMDNDQSALRIVSRLTGRGNIETITRHDTNELADLRLAAQTARAMDQKAKLHLCDEPNLTLQKLSMIASHYVKNKGCGIVAVDYMGIIETLSAQSRYQEVGRLSSGLLQLARKLRVPLLVGCQLNRAVEGRATKRPCLADLRDSGNIEQDAHAVIFIHREDYYAVRDPNGPALDFYKPVDAEIIVSKNRMGRVGMVKLAFRPATTSFHNFKPGGAI